MSTSIVLPAHPESLHPDAVRAVLQLSGDAVYLHDAETGDILDANGRAYALHGYTIEELKAIGIAGISDGAPPYAAGQALIEIRRAAAGIDTQFEWLMKRCSGERVWVEVHLHRVRIDGKDRVLSTVREITDRKRAEDALGRVQQELEQRLADRTAELEGIFQALPDLYFRLGRDGVVVDYRAGLAAEIFAPREEWRGKPLLEMLPPEAQPSLTQALAEVRRTDQLVCIEYAVTRDDGPRSFEARLLPRPTGEVIAIIRDTTERRRFEEALRRSEERFRSVVENSSDLVTLMDPAGTISYQSHAVERTFGYGTDELIGQNALDFIHPEDLPEVASKLAEVAAHPGESRAAQFRFRHKEGHWVHVEAAGATLSPAGPAEGVVVNTRDISERKQAELTLQETTRFLQNLIASSPGVIFRGSGETFRTTYISPNAEAVLGYTAEAFLSTPQLWVERTHPEDREPVTAAIVGAMEQGLTDLTYEYRFLHADGEYRHLLASVRFERDSRTQSVEVLGYTFDVSRLKAAEAALRQAKDEAERANRAKSEFLSRMSHELRTPMNSILGFAQLLTLAELQPNQHRAVERIHTAGKHLLNLINEVLDLARIESGHQSLSLEPVQVSSALKEALSLIRPLASQRDCRLPDELPSELAWYVCADRQRLTQVFLNLLSNAVKYNRAGGEVSLHAQVRAADSPEGVLRIGVRDTGAGIPTRRLGELFQPFSRLEADRSEIEGTGLGLTLSKTLVETMGGEIFVESVEGEGSTFWIELRLSDGPPDGGDPRGAERQEKHMARIAPRPVSILYIEDNRANRTLIEELFASYPEVTLHSAPGARTGLEDARKHRPDLILLDLHLPDLSGDEVLAELQGDPETRTIPVIVISADATHERMEGLRGRGASEYLTKPLDLDQLLSVVAATLEGDLTVEGPPDPRDRSGLLDPTGDPEE